MSDQSNTAASDVEYNIVTTLSNLLQAQDVLETYAEDAREAGDEELAAIFDGINNANHEFANQLRQQLHKLMH